MTKQRKLIYSIIILSEKHMIAEDIYKKAKKEMPSIAMGTVYRNLSLMVEAGEIRKITMFNAPDRYDKTLVTHDHLICEICGDLSDVEFLDLKKYLKKQTGLDIISYEINLKYVCDECKKKNNIL